MEESGAPVERNVHWRSMARSERFELPTLGFEVRCSIQLSYERMRRLDYQTWPDWATRRSQGNSFCRAGPKSATAPIDAALPTPASRRVLMWINATHRNGV